MPKHSVRDPKTGRFTDRPKPSLVELASRGITLDDNIESDYIPTERDRKYNTFFVPERPLWTRIKTWFGGR